MAQKKLCDEYLGAGRWGGGNVGRGEGGALLAAAGIMVPGQRLPSRQKTATSSPTVADAEGDDVLAARAPVRLYFFQQGRRRIIADLLFLPFFRAHTHTHAELGLWSMCI